MNVINERKINRMIHDSVRKNLLLIQAKKNVKSLVKEGKSRQYINEYALGSLLGGLGGTGIKVGAGSTATSTGMDSEETDFFSEARLMITESLIEKILEIFRIDPNSILGTVVTQTLSNCLRKIELDDIKEFLSTSDCDQTARAFGSCVIQGLQRGFATKIVAELIEFLTGEEIADIKKGFGGQFYRSLNDKITKGINTALNDPALLDMVSDKICAIDIYSILTDEVLPYASELFFDTLGDIGDTLKGYISEGLIHE